MNIDEISEETHNIRYTTLWERFTLIPSQTKRLKAIAHLDLSWWSAFRVVLHGVCHGLPIFHITKK